MRIAVFSDTYTPEVNGVARTIERYAEYLNREQIEYKLFIPDSSTPVPAVPQVQRFASMPFLLYPECRLALPNPARASHVLKDFQPDLIHIATPFNLGLYGLYYGKKYNIPMVASYHTHFDNYLEYYHLSFLQKWIWKYLTWFYRPFKKVYVPSVSTKEKLVRRGFHDHLEIWGRGVDHTLYTPERKTIDLRKKYNITEKYILLYTGRIAPEKDLPVALEAFHRLSADIKKDCHFLVVGDGPLLKQLSDKKQSQVTFTGFLEGKELADVYASSDLFVFPSATETFGNVVLEAMASGLPVIGAGAGGVKHLVEQGETGFLCQPGNPDEFAEKISYLIKNENLRFALARKAREFALTKSWDQIFSELLCSLEETAGKNQKKYTA